MAENSKGQNREGQTREDLSRNTGRQNASANRGGTTDMDDEALTVDRDRRQERGSGMETKRTVTGSDFDGQVSGE